MNDITSNERVTVTLLGARPIIHVLLPYIVARMLVAALSHKAVLIYSIMRHQRTNLRTVSRPTPHFACARVSWSAPKRDEPPCAVAPALPIAPGRCGPFCLDVCAADVLVPSTAELSTAALLLCVLLRSPSVFMAGPSSLSMGWPSSSGKR